MTGRLPVQNFKIETIFDHTDPRLTAFRENIFINDLKLDPTIMHEHKPYAWWVNKFDKSIAEDAFKYSNYKWNNVNFDNIEAITEGANIVGISGCRKYNGFLRTSMHLYLLKSVRSVYPGIKYIEGGWFERHMQYAIDQGCTGMFFTVYAYSRKLEALINNHRTRTISLINKSYLKYIDQIQEKGEYMFNNVPQTFFYYSLSTSLEEFNPNDFI